MPNGLRRFLLYYSLTLGRIFRVLYMAGVVEIQETNLNNFQNFIKAISIKEPWATRILQGKTIETRTWKTDYRGPLLLCASKKPESNISGKAFAIVDLVDCRPMKYEDERAAMCKVYPGAVSWFFKNLRRIKPFPIKGQLGLFTVDISRVVYE